MGQQFVSCRPDRWRVMSHRWAGCREEPEMNFYLWPGREMGGCALPVEIHTTRHLLKYDQSAASPFSSYGGSSFQRAHKDWVQLDCLNGSGAPGHSSSDQQNGPHCVDHGHRGLAEFCCFLRVHLAGRRSYPSNAGTGISTCFG